MSPLVSVIIPTYNSADYISESIGSVLSQTYADFEIIVVDDGSTDNTAEVVKLINDRRIKYIKTDNKGNYFARNRGVRESAGEYIAFLDADDIWMKGKLKAQVSILDKHKDIGLCCTDHYLFFGKKKEDVYIDTLHSFSEDFLSHSNFIEKLLLENVIITSSVIIRKSCFEHLGVFDTGCQNAMDYEMWLRITLNYRAYYLRDRCLLKRIHVSNISENKINTLNALLYIFNKMDSYVECAKFSGRKYRPLVRKKIQNAMYNLGLEYLRVKNYASAFQYLRNSEHVEKKIFRYLAMFVARFRIGFLVPLINLYRLQRQRSSLVPAKENFNESVIREIKNT